MKKVKLSRMDHKVLRGVVEMLGWHRPGSPDLLPLVTAWVKALRSKDLKTANSILKWLRAETRKSAGAKAA